MLSVRDLEVRYGDQVALTGVSLSVDDGEFVAVIGSNAAGKSTLLKAIAGVAHIAGGSIMFGGEDVTARRADARVARGIVLVPEGRHIFPYLTVEENLRLGAWAKHLRAGADKRLAEVCDMVPRLKERRTQQGGSLSGGEQQILAIGRALMSRPRILLLDEPSLGLSPLWVSLVFDVIRQITAEGTSILLVEQNVPLALELAQRGYVLANGRCVMGAPASQLRSDDEVRKAYMGL